jgi:hypothetical protein
MIAVPLLTIKNRRALVLSIYFLNVLSFTKEEWENREDLFRSADSCPRILTTAGHTQNTSAYLTPSSPASETDFRQYHRTH